MFTRCYKGQAKRAEGRVEDNLGRMKKDEGFYSLPACRGKAGNVRGKVKFTKQGDVF